MAARTPPLPGFECPVNEEIRDQALRYADVAK
jgi:hypothetical protein